MGCSYSVPTRVTAAPATTTPSMSATTGIQVGYVTDVEGNVDYFDEWVKHSGILRYSSADELEFTNDGAYFVFGGDAMDRCDGGMRFTRRLVALKKRHPDRVFLLAGNRDLNKVRFTSELAESDLSRPPSEIPGPHWDPRAPTLEKYLTEIAAEKGVEGGAAAVDNRAERMRYYLKHTLGCPRTFEDRRKELTILGEGGPEPISDDAVVDSLISDIQPGGCLRSYLEHAQLATILGNTIFVHGALDPTSIKLVPDVKTRFHLPSGPQPMVKHESVKGWADAFNSLLKEGLKQHLASPEWDAKREYRGGEVLLALQNRAAMWGRCIVSCAYADGGSITSPQAAEKLAGLRKRVAEATPEEPASGLWFEEWTSDPRDADVANWLLSAGIRRICVGHKPSGDSPASCSSVYTGVEVISADTSYADFNDKVGGRGCSIAGVTLAGPSLQENAARIFGVLADGREHEATLATLSSKGKSHDTPGDAHVGTELPEGWWCKAKMVSSTEKDAKPTYRLCKGSGRQVEYKDQEL